MSRNVGETAEFTRGFADGALAVSHGVNPEERQDATAAYKDGYAKGYAAAKKAAIEFVISPVDGQAGK